MVTEEELDELFIQLNEKTLESILALAVQLIKFNKFFNEALNKRKYDFLLSYKENWGRLAILESVMLVFLKYRQEIAGVDELASKEVKEKAKYDAEVSERLDVFYKSYRGRLNVVTDRKVDALFTQLNKKTLEVLLKLLDPLFRIHQLLEKALEEKNYDLLIKYFVDSKRLSNLYLAIGDILSFRVESGMEDVPESKEIFEKLRYIFLSTRKIVDFYKKQGFRIK